jgi:hypothetical protein
MAAEIGVPTVRGVQSGLMDYGAAKQKSNGNGAPAINLI